MSEHLIEQVIKKLKAAGFDDKEDPFIGCSESEIEKLERHYKIKLPASYKEFLSAMGKDCGNFLLGYDYTYETLFSLNEGSQEIIAEDPSCTFKLSRSDFVFMSSQGSQFLFFDTESGDEPAVQYFLEGAMPYQKYGSFSHCLEQLVDAQIEAARVRAIGKK